MSNEELERIMNFIIERQERFAEQQELLIEQDKRFAAEFERQHALNNQLQNVMLSVAEAQQRNTADIGNLAAVVDRIVEAMPKGSNGNGNTP